MTTNLIRRIALPIVSAGVIGCATLGLAGTAGAAAVVDPQPQPGFVAVPQTMAEPAANATPGWWWHRHHPSLLDPAAAAQFMPPGM
ncbi:MAG: hypothetical protein JST91_15935 [Actinobacteria bacterium]|nr:hypothetical protein [Actinomycetota bacterium]